MKIIEENANLNERVTGWIWVFYYLHSPQSANDSPSQSNKTYSTLPMLRALRSELNS